MIRFEKVLRVDGTYRIYFNVKSLRHAVSLTTYVAHERSGITVHRLNKLGRYFFMKCLVKIGSPKMNRIDDDYHESIDAWWEAHQLSRALNTPLPPSTEKRARL